MLRPRRRSPVRGLGDARKVIASIIVSAFGTYGYNVGIAVYAYQQTGSPAWVAAVTAGRYVPALVIGWTFGGIADRLPRRAVAVCADLGCAAVMLVLAVLGSASAPLLLVTLVAALSSTLARLQSVSVLALAADIVVESQLARASVLASAGEAVAAALGSAVASLVLLDLTPAVLFAGNAVTFLVSAALLTALPKPRRRSRQRHASPGRSPNRAVGTTVYWPLQAARTVAAVVNGVDVVLLTVIAARQLHGGTASYGWLLAAAGIGGLIAIGPSRRLRIRGLAAVTTGGLLLYALPLAIFAAGPPVAAAVAVQVVRGAGSVLTTSSVMAGLQRAVPSSMSGRVFGRTQSLVLLGTCIGAIGVPVVLHFLGLTSTIVLPVVLAVVAQLVLTRFLLRFDERESTLLAALDPRLSTLRSLDLLRDASRSTLYAIADGIDELEAAPGTVVIAEGDPSDALYVLVAGTAQASVAGPDGPTVLRRMTAPEHFGEIGLLRGIDRTATVSTVTRCQMWRVPGTVFLTAIAEAGVSSALTDTTQLRFATTPPASSPRDRDRSRPAPDVE